MDIFADFGLKALGGLWENHVYGRTTDARVTTVALLSVAQTRAKDRKKSEIVPKVNLNTNSPLDTKFYPWSTNFGPFRCTTCVSEINVVKQIHRMTPNWTWTLNSQKYTVYTEYLPLRHKVYSISQRCNLKLLLPCCPMLTKRKQWSKIQNLKFYNFLNKNG